MKRERELLPKVYAALFDISLLRDEVRTLAEHDAQRFLSRIETLEAKALQLLDRFESQTRVVTH
jgi:hypothetical protein